MKTQKNEQVQILSTSNTLHEIVDVKNGIVTFRIYFGFEFQSSVSNLITTCDYTVRNSEELAKSAVVISPLKSRNLLNSPNRIKTQPVKSGKIDLSKFLPNNIATTKKIIKKKLIIDSSTAAVTTNSSQPADSITDVDSSADFDLSDIFYRELKDPADEINKIDHHIAIDKMMQGTDKRNNTTTNSRVIASTSNSKSSTTTSGKKIITEETGIIDAHFDVNFKKSELKTYKVQISGGNQQISFLLDLKKMYNEYIIPVHPPKLTVSRVGNKRIVEVQQVDKNCESVVVFKKSTTDNSFKMLNTSSLKTRNTLKFIDDVFMSPAIYRAISLNENFVGSGVFNSAIGKGDKNFRPSEPDTLTLHTFENFDSVNISIYNIPKEVVSVHAVRRNLTSHEKNFVDINPVLNMKETGTGTSRANLTLSKVDVDLVDKQVRPDSIYEYKVKMIDVYGNEKLSKANSIIHYEGSSSSVESNTLQISKLSVENNRSVSFFIESSNNDNSFNLIYDALITAGYDSFYLNEVKSNREQLKNLLAIEISRFDTTTGLNEYFGVTKIGNFSDSSTSRVNKNISQINAGRTYIYQLRLLTRSPSSLITGSTKQSADLETSKNYTINMKKFAGPTTLKRGSIASNSIQKGAIYKNGYILKRTESAESEFQKGRTSITSRVVVKIPASQTKISSANVSSTARGNIIHWSIQQGDQEIDSIIIYADCDGSFAPLKAVHQSATEQSFLDTKLNVSLDNVKYYLQIIYSNYTKGPMVGPLKEI
jgi:predicted CoA-binding protein